MTAPSLPAADLKIDPRVTLCDLELHENALCGVADGSLRERLRAYAEKRGVGLEVLFPDPKPGQVTAGRTPLYRHPSPDAETVSELGFGEAVRVFDAFSGFVRVASARDGYLGWVGAETLGTLPAPTHRFAALRGHVYREPEVSAERLLELSYGATLCVRDETGGWARVVTANGEGFVNGAGLEPLPVGLEPRPEAVIRLALRFLETPYLWGGVSAWGLDCSGLVQTVFGAFGVSLPRDADQQAACGRVVAPDAVRAADLFFFPGHVALALGRDRFVHANAHRMRVSVDGFSADDYGRRLRAALTRAVRILP